MKNGYFRLVTTQRGFGIMLIKPKDGGAPIKGMELTAFLDQEGLAYDLTMLKAALGSAEDTVLELGAGTCPAVGESYALMISQDGMSVQAQFFPPSSTGSRIDVQELLRDLKFKNVIYGILQDTIDWHFQSEGCYDRPLLIAKGQPPRNGKDAEIEYFFNTNPQIQPTVREDGSVDYFQLNMINHCRQGEVLARIIPADPGDAGTDVFGRRVKPRDVRQQTLKFGNNIQLSEDRLQITSLVDGHVMLVDDKVFVSNVYEVENVDLSTGNIDFVGSVQVNGNVKENMSIKAGGNVVVNGVVEGAYIEAVGNIVIARGMNGKAKGTLKAGGNVISKFLENTTVEAAGYVNSESILHSRVRAGTEVNVIGKRALIVGGRVQAGRLVSMKNLGAQMGNTTEVQVGILPEDKAQMIALQNELADVIKEIKNAQPILVGFAQKKAQGAKFTVDQLRAVAQLDKMIREKSSELTEKNDRLKALQERMNEQKDAHVEVQGIVYSGTTIRIEDLSFTVKSEYQYCRFDKKDGEIKMMPL